MSTGKIAHDERQKESRRGRSRPSKTAIDDRARKMADLYFDHWIDVDAIAERYGVCIETVGNAIRKHRGGRSRG